MNFVKITLLRLVARNIQSLVDFITLLDKRFDDFVVKQEQALADLNTQQAILDQTYQDASKFLQDKATAVQRDTQIAKNMKAALPINGVVASEAEAPSAA